MIQHELAIIPLGGLGEIGMNCMAYRYGEAIILVDAGLMFPDHQMPGIDYVLPDFSWLLEHREQLCGIFLTHGHEDHIGALPFLLADVTVPVFGTRLTLGLLENKLKEHQVVAELCPITPRQQVNCGPFQIECLRVTHSVVDGCAFAITTPLGTVIHTGDFKIDPTPVDGEQTDLASFSRYGDQGVLALLSDSTNVEREGHTISERYVGEALAELIPPCSGWVVVAVFSSNIHRIQQIADVALKSGRKLLLNGRSMVANVAIARSLGYLHIPDHLFMDIRELPFIPRDQVCMITTGSQGEPMSSLSRIALGEHKQIQLQEGDTVILSSRSIPGNERTISELINHLYRRGAQVHHEKVSEVHVSGHASQDELRQVLELVRPEYFIPIHGEYRHLILHRALAVQSGIPKENCFVLTNGIPFVFGIEGGRYGEAVETGRVCVDGKGVGDVGPIVLKDRRVLAEDGMIVVMLGICMANGACIYGPELLSRGFVHEDESQEYLNEARQAVLNAVTELSPEARTDIEELKSVMRQTVKRFVKKSRERRPMILPVVLEF